jgi:hypothetical protein
MPSRLTDTEILQLGGGLRIAAGHDNTVVVSIVWPANLADPKASEKLQVLTEMVTTTLANANIAPAGEMEACFRAVGPAMEDMLAVTTIPVYANRAAAA